MPSPNPSIASPTPQSAAIKAGMKKMLIIIALALFVCLAVIGSRPDEPIVASASDTSRGPIFEVQVVKPRSARPLFGILPARLEAKLLGDEDLRFDNASRGAEIGRVGHDRLELKADGWELFIETDGEGRVAPGTHLVFPIVLAEKQRSLSCRTGDQASDSLLISSQAGPDQLDGSFLVELTTCVNIDTGKTIEWPPRPLTVRGSFEGLPLSLR